MLKKISSLGQKVYHFGQGFFEKNQDIIPEALAFSGMVYIYYQLAKYTGIDTYLAYQTVTNPRFNPKHVLQFIQDNKSLINQIDFAVAATAFSLYGLYCSYIQEKNLNTNPELNIASPRPEWLMRG